MREAALVHACGTAGTPGIADAETLSAQLARHEPNAKRVAELRIVVRNP
jgi:hypothetical protein